MQNGLSGSADMRREASVSGAGPPTGAASNVAGTFIASPSANDYVNLPGFGDNPNMSIDIVDLVVIYLGP